MAKLQLNSTGSKNFKMCFQGSSKKTKRQAPIQELVDTEDKYLENLIMVRDKFRDRLTLISPQDKAIIFYKLVSHYRLLAQNFFP